jgi:pyruvate dehydrogenase E2 component (dihydrolipoamide acetyltransferase)
MDAILKARTALNSRLGEKISLNAFIIKFAAKALTRFPLVNSSWQGEYILRFKSVDIGLAVAQHDGLITPVVRNLSHKGIIALDEELNELIKRARSGDLSPEEYTNATFTISSLGNYGIEEFTAIINPPGSAILAIGEIMREPVVEEDDNIKIRSIMKLTLSCDHRVIDGAYGAQFLKSLKDMMENPIEALY